MGFWGSSAASNQSKNDSAQSAEQEPSTSAVLAKALRGDIQDENVQKSISKHQKSDSTKSMRSLANKRVNELQLSEFPDEMSCFTAMSELLECMSLGGEVRNYYRYGDFSMCDKQTKKLNFCLKNSSKPKDVRGKNIQQYYKDQLVEKLKRGSSEDIWEARK